MAGQGRVLVTTEGDVAVACLMDARILDETNVQALHKELEDVVAKKYILKLVIDFKNVTHLSSAVIGKFANIGAPSVSFNSEVSLLKGPSVLTAPSSTSGNRSGYLFR